MKIKRYLIDVLEEEHAPIRRRREELAKIQKRLWKCCIKEVLLLKSGSTKLNRSQKAMNSIFLSNKRTGTSQRRMTCSSSQNSLKLTII